MCCCVLTRGGTQTRNCSFLVRNKDTDFFEKKTIQFSRVNCHSKYFWDIGKLKLSWTIINQQRWHNCVMKEFQIRFGWLCKLDYTTTGLQKFFFNYIVFDSLTLIFHVVGQCYWLYLVFRFWWEFSVKCVYFLFL